MRDRTLLTERGVERNFLTGADGACYSISYISEIEYFEIGFVMNELKEEIDLIRHEAMYRLHAYGSKVAFWRDLDRFPDERIAMFPHEEKRTRSLYAEMKAPNPLRS